MVVLLLAGCGSSGTNRGPAGAGTHDTADGAARGLVNALAADDVKAAQDWIYAGEREEFGGAFDSATALGLKATFRVKDFAVVSVQDDRNDANLALLTYRGKVEFCLAGDAGGRTVNSCTPVQSELGRTSTDTFVCVRQDGAWYISFRGHE